MSINKMLQDLQKYSNILKESYVFDNENDTIDYEGEGEEMPSEPMDNEMPMNNDPSEKISQIRSIALEGIQMFAENVDSEEYDFFKKVWLMCDKVCSEKESNESTEE